MADWSNHVLLILQLVITGFLLYITLQRADESERLRRLEADFQILFENWVELSQEHHLKIKNEEERRMKRQVDLQSNPMVLDYAYKAKLPEATSNLQVYDMWGRGSSLSPAPGLNQMPRAQSEYINDQLAALTRTQQLQYDSANAFLGYGPSRTSSQSQFRNRGGSSQSEDRGGGSSSQTQHRGSGGSSQPQYSSSLGISDDDHTPDLNDHLGLQGMFVEIPGNAPPKTHIIRSNSYTVRGSGSVTTVPPAPQDQSVLKPPTSRQDSGATRQFKRPRVRSLGSPDQPPRQSTAIHLIPGSDGPEGPFHTHWRPSPWSQRLHVTRSFPLASGTLRVSTPGLYLVYAQLSYESHSAEGFSATVNDEAELTCRLQAAGTGSQTSGTCHTAGLLYLEQGDRLNIRDTGSGGGKLSQEAGTSFFGLVKLTADWI